MLKRVVLTAVVLSLLACAGCAPKPAEIVVSPSLVTLNQANATQKVEAVVKDAKGGVITGQTLTWATSDPSIAKVDAAGVISAVSSGDAIVTAGLKQVSGTCQVKVAIPFALEVNPQMLALEVNAKATLTGAVKTEKGTNLGGFELTWESDNPAVAEINAAGEVLAKAEGEANITAKAAGLDKKIPVKVNPVAAPKPMK